MTKRIVVNYWRLFDLANYDWLSEDELAALWRAVDPNDEVGVKKAIRDHLLPHWQRSPYWPALRESLRINLRYFLTTERFPAGELYEQSLPAFSAPDDPIAYYRWCWEVVFGDERYQLASLEGYVEQNDRDALSHPTRPGEA